MSEVAAAVDRLLGGDKATLARALTVVENAEAEPIVQLVTRTGDTETVKPMLFKHPVTVEFTGSYPKIVEYVKRIEALDHCISHLMDLARDVRVFSTEAAGHPVTELLERPLERGRAGLVEADAENLGFHGWPQKRR